LSIVPVTVFADAIWLEELPGGVTFANPKSRILVCPRLVTKMFGRLDVGVNDAFDVGGIQRVRNFNGKCEQCVIVQRPAGNHGLYGHAVHKLHCDERTTILLANVVNGADIRMVLGRSGSRFALESPWGLRISRHFVRQELQSDKAMKPGVFGLVNHTHPATA
jgi:hypothetical protein